MFGALLSAALSLNFFISHIYLCVFLPFLLLGILFVWPFSFLVFHFFFCKYFHNTFKTLFFCLTLNLRRLIAHRWRHFLYLYVILLLLLLLILFKFVPICGHLLLLFIGRILTLSRNKVKHYNVGAISLRRLVAKSPPTLFRHNL